MDGYKSLSPKELENLKHLSKNRLPVQGVFVERLIEENKQLRSALVGLLQIGMTYQQQLDAIYLAKDALKDKGE